ncbi:MAG TPA: serine protease [Propionicimonas sp.]|nr:serine protease [Propionicimonas sp.]
MINRGVTAAGVAAFALTLVGCGLFAAPLLTARPVDATPFENVVAPTTLSVAKVGGTRCAGGEPIGSAFVAGDHLVLTAAHVVAGARTVELRFPGREPVAADVVIVDAGDDTAVLRVDSDLPPALALAATPVVAGEPVVVVGYPLAERQVRTTLSRVTALDESVVLDGHLLRDVLALDAQVPIGTSGGPVVDAAGQVHGMVSAQVAGRGGRDSSQVVTLGIPAPRLAQRLATSANQPAPTPCT